MVTLTLAEFNRFVAMMSRTVSDSDGEALNAIRAANKVIMSRGLTWDMVLRRVCRVISEVEDGSGVELRPATTPEPRPTPVRSAPRPPADDGEDWDALFEMALSGANSEKFEGVLLDIQAQHERQGWMSGRQKQVVRDAAERAADRHPGGRVG